MLVEQLLLRCLLDGACDPLSALRCKDEGAEAQQIQWALQQFQSFSRVLGRHVTRVCAGPDKMTSSQLSTPALVPSVRNPFVSNEMPVFRQACSCIYS
jgi:hypothetical protein